MRAPTVRPVPTAVLALAAGALAALPACSDPTLSITLDVDGDLAARVADPDAPPVTVRVRAIDAARAAQGDWQLPDATAAEATCDDVLFARIPPAILDAATIATTTDGHVLPAVPRLGAKLLGADARTATGRVDGIGCKPLGEIAGDDTATVSLAPALRLVAVNRASGRPEDTAFLALRAWDDVVIPLADRGYEIRRHDRLKVLPAPASRALIDGPVIVTDVTGGAAAGPVEVVVCARNATEPLRLARWVALPELGHLLLPIAPGTAARWAVGPTRLGASTDWTAMAAYDDATGAHRLSGVRYDGGFGEPYHFTAEQGVVAGAPLILDNAPWLIAADGWHLVTPAGVVATPDHPESFGAATEAIAVQACDETVLALVRRPDDTYQVYNADAALIAEPPLPIGSIRGRHALDLVCVADGSGAPVELMLLADDDGRLWALNRAGTLDVALDELTAVTDFTVAVGMIRVRRGLAAYVSAGGPRAKAFRFATFGTDADQSVTVVPALGLDVPLAGQAAALVALNLDGDPLPNDVAAVVPSSPGLRLQAVLDDDFLGQPVSGISERLPLGVGVPGRPRLRLDNVNEDGVRDIVVQAGDGIIVYAGTTAP